MSEIQRYRRHTENYCCRSRRTCRVNGIGIGIVFDIGIVESSRLAVDVILLLVLIVIVPSLATVDGSITNTSNFTLIMSLKDHYQALQMGHPSLNNYRSSMDTSNTGNNHREIDFTDQHQSSSTDDDNSDDTTNTSDNDIDIDTMAVDYGPISLSSSNGGQQQHTIPSLSSNLNKYTHIYNISTLDTSLREILDELFNNKNSNENDINNNNNNNNNNNVNNNSISIFDFNDMHILPNVAAGATTRATTLLTTIRSIATNRTSSSASTSRQDIMNTWVYLTWLIVFSVMIFIAICGNLIVMWIVIAHRRMRTVTNYFLVNLSCADLLMSTLNCMFNFIYMLHNHWSFGEWYCTINNFMCTVTVSASVFTLTAITCDRYMAIVRPLQPRMSKRIALVAIAFVWFTSCIIGLPSLIYSSLHKFETSSGAPERIACTLIWPDGLSIISQMDFTYQVVLMVLSYFVPIILMVWCYYGMGRVLWGSRSIGEMSQRQADSIRSKRKVVKMFIFVMIVFVICWLPYHAYFIYTHFDRSILVTDWVQHVYLGFYWLAMSNAMVNPLIYYWMNARFRKYFKTAVCGWKGYIVRKTIRFKGQQGNETPVLGRHTHSFSRSATDDPNGEPMYHFTRWFSRRNRHRQTRSTIVRGSAKFNRTGIDSNTPAAAITIHHQNGTIQQQPQQLQQYTNDSNTSTPRHLNVNRATSMKRHQYNYFTSYPCPSHYNDHIETAHV